MIFFVIESNGISMTTCCSYVRKEVSCLKDSIPSIWCWSSRSKSDSHVNFKSEFVDRQFKAGKSGFVVAYLIWQDLEFVETGPQ